VAGIGGRSAGGGGQAQNQVVPINGQRANGNNYTLDGGDNHDPFFNTPAIFPSPDALEEFSIQTSVYGADKGRNPGATMTVFETTPSESTKAIQCSNGGSRSDRPNAFSSFSILR